MRCRSAAQRKCGSERSAIDEFYARVIEHAVAYFGSRVLYPSRPAPEPMTRTLSRAACEKAAQAAVARDAEKFEVCSRKTLGYRIGSQIYDAYLAGKVAPRGLRRLFLAHLDEPGLARKVCAAVIAKLRTHSPTAKAAPAPRLELMLPLLRGCPNPSANRRLQCRVLNAECS